MPKIKLITGKQIVSNSFLMFFTQRGIGSLVGDFVLSWILANGIPSNFDEIFLSVNILELAKNFALIWLVMFVLYLIPNFFIALFENFDKIQKAINKR